MPSLVSCRFSGFFPFFLLFLNKFACLFWSDFRQHPWRKKRFPFIASIFTSRKNESAPRFLRWSSATSLRSSIGCGSHWTVCQAKMCEKIVAQEKIFSLGDKTLTDFDTLRTKTFFAPAMSEVWGTDEGPFVSCVNSEISFSLNSCLELSFSSLSSIERILSEADVTLPVRAFR